MPHLAHGIPQFGYLCDVVAALDDPSRVVLSGDGDGVPRDSALLLTAPIMSETWPAGFPVKLYTQSDQLRHTPLACLCFPCWWLWGRKIPKFVGVGPLAGLSSAYLIWGSLGGGVEHDELGNIGRRGSRGSPPATSGVVVTRHSSLDDMHTHESTSQ